MRAPPRAGAAVVPGMRVPGFALEVWYYAQVFYAVMGAALGLSAGFLGVATLGLLASVCLLHYARRPLAILLPLWPLAAFALAHALMQILVFRESLTGPLVRPMISWTLNLIVIQCLALRQGFFHRAAIAIFMVGLCTIPFLTTDYAGSNARVGLTAGISIANPNDLAAWFGFCGVYFLVVALEARRMWVRVAAVLLATSSVYVVALTVSRGPLFAVALALLVACRRLLKRGFLPFVVLVVLAWVAVGFGVFDRSASLYAERGLEESGRFVVWPIVVDRILAAPLTGVGGANIMTTVFGTMDMMPHNQFLFIALSSGLVPLALFVIYWVRLAVGMARLNAGGHPDAVFFVPLFVYALIIGLELDTPFMLPWFMVVLGSLSASVFLLQARRAVATPVARPAADLGPALPQRATGRATP